MQGRLDNAFGNASPISLLDKGKEVLNESGLKKFIDDNKDALMKKCSYNKDPLNQYDIQEKAFTLFDELDFGEFTKTLKETSFNYGMSIDTIRRIGGIYFRDLLLAKHNFHPNDLDRPKT